MPSDGPVEVIARTLMAHKSECPTVYALAERVWAELGLWVDATLYDMAAEGSADRGSEEGGAR